ncbi:MAG: hypothetical protein RI958_3298 [Actinomycetota bacterium]|jgi:zinc/manganese transport system substrate-binding protein
MIRPTTTRSPARSSGRRLVPLLIAAAVALTSCSTGERSSEVALVDGRPLVVVTYSILGDLVEQLVGDAAAVEVTIPNGLDPHDHAVSAREVERMRQAALIVANGLDLEEGLVDAIHEAEDDGIPVFEVADHVTVRELADGGDGGDDEHTDGSEAADEHGHADGDPHLWTDPLTMAEMAPALAEALERELGVDLSESLEQLIDELDRLDAEVRSTMSVIPDGACRLVTGHESLGYFADRYDCTVIGAVIASLSSTAEASSGEMADLIELAETEDVRAIFTEIGTPSGVARQVADEVGVPLVELPSHKLPDTGGYRAYILDLATRIAGALGRT